MQIQLKLVGALSRYLPADRQGNQVSIELAEGSSVTDVMHKIMLPGDQQYLVSVNDEVVRKADRESRTLADADRVTIMPPLRGG